MFRRYLPCNSRNLPILNIMSIVQLFDNSPPPNRNLIYIPDRPGDLVVDLLDVVSGFSRFYSRELELNLEDMELKEIMERLQGGGGTEDEGWKLDAYLGKLISRNVI